MGVPKSIRLDKDLEKDVELYIDKNSIKFPKLINLALREFISKKRPLKLDPVSDEDYEKLTKENIKKHRKTLDLLK